MIYSLLETTMMLIVISLVSFLLDLCVKQFLPAKISKH